MYRETSNSSSQNVVRKEPVRRREKFSFKQSAKDTLITSQLRAALIVNKNIKSGNYQIDTYKKNIYIYGIARNRDELEIVVDEANSILDVNKVTASILLVEDLRIQKD